MDEWVQSAAKLRTDPNIAVARRLLGIPAVHLVGHWHYLLWWAVTHADDGDLSEVSPYAVADAAGWEGDPEAFLSALKQSGLVTSDGIIADWHAYTGRLLETRRRNREKVAAHRLRTRDVTERNHPVTVTGGVQAGYVPVTPVTVTACNASTETVTETETVTARETPQKAKSKAGEGPSAPSRTRMTPPTQEECEEYWFTKSLEGEAVDFWLHWQGHGWRFGNGAPMKDWRATAQRWSREEVKRRAEAKARQSAPGPRRPAGPEPMDNSSEAVLARLRANMEKGGILNP